MCPVPNGLPQTHPYEDSWRERMDDIENKISTKVPNELEKIGIIALNTDHFNVTL